MTVEKAIEILECHRVSQFGGMHGEILSVSEIIDLLRGASTERDLISRQAATDVVSEACREWRGIFGRCEDGLDWGWVWNPNDPDGPNEIRVERLQGWEEIYDERENKTYWAPCLRLDFNPQPLRGRI